MVARGEIKKSPVIHSFYSFFASFFSYFFLLFLFLFRIECIVWFVYKVNYAQNRKLYILSRPIKITRFRFQPPNVHDFHNDSFTRLNGGSGYLQVCLGFGNNIGCDLMMKVFKSKLAILSLLTFIAYGIVFVSTIVA